MEQRMSGAWLRRILIALVVMIVAGSMIVVWRFLPYSVSYYTDAQSIREPIRNVQPRDILWQSPTPIDVPAINTDVAEYEPRLSWDGLTLFFVRGKPGENADIYESRKSPGGWSEPELLSDICTDADELGPEPSPDGQRLYFYSDRPEGLGGYDLWVSERGTEGWSAPTNLGAMVNTPFNEYSPALTPDSNILYFSSNRPRTGDVAAPQAAWHATIREDFSHHDYDLYFVSLVGGMYGPVVAVSELNSGSNEGSPAVSPAGDFLYFSSDRTGGSGGFDLYRSRLLRGGHESPITLGPSVNTPFNELDPALGSLGYALYFSSDRLADRSVPAFERDYDLFQTTSREVFRESETIQRAAVDWVGLWKKTWPNLLAALLALALIALVLWLVGDMRRRRLSLLAKCLLVSLVTHLAILFLTTFWGVTTNIAAALRQGSGKVHVSLAGGDSSHVRSGLEGQVRGTFVAMPGPTPERLIAPIEAPIIQPRIEHQPVALGVQTSTRPPSEVPSVLMRSTDVMVAAPSMRPPAERRTELVADVLTMQIALPARTAPATPAASEPVSQVAARSFDEQSVRPAAVAMAPSTTAEVMRIQPQTNSRPIGDASTAKTAIPINLNEGAAVSSINISTELPTLAAADVQIGLALPSHEPSAMGDGIENAPAVTPQPVELAREQGIALRFAASGQPIAQIAPAANPSKYMVVPEGATGLMSAVVDSRPSVTSNVPATGPVELPRGDTDAGLSLSLPKTDAALQSAREGELAESVKAGSAIAANLAGKGGSNISHPKLQLKGRIDGEGTKAFRIDPQSGTKGARGDGDGPARSGLSFPALVDRAQTGEHPQLPVALDIDIADGPSLSLSLPTELPAPENPYAQRSTEKREDMLEEMGGSDETEQAVARGLAWLAAHQSRDGHWDGDQFDQACGKCGGVSSYQVDVALTGLSLLSFLGGDHTHMKDGVYKDNVDRGLKWLMARQLPNGDLRGGAETMYSHGIATIALAEAYGMTNDGRLADSVRRAVSFIEKARNTRVGGWRYDPGQVGDTSVLGWQVMALKSAQRAGVDVAATSFEAAGAWLDLVTTKPGIYAYQPEREVTPAMTAEGMFVRYVLGGRREAPHMRASSEFILERLPDWKKEPNTYYWYYATLAAHQHQGDTWTTWNEAIKSQLVMHQRKSGKAEGSWDPVGEWSDVGGRVYQTALCTLMLEVYYRYLPMYKLDSGATGSVGTTLGSAALTSP